MVEHLLAKEKAAGSNPVFRSILFLTGAAKSFVSSIFESPVSRRPA